MNKFVLSRIVNYLHDYIIFDINKINWEFLSGNPAAIHLIEEELKSNSCRIDWEWLSENPAAIHLLKKNKKYDKLELFIGKPGGYSYIGRGIKIKFK